MSAKLYYFPHPFTDERHEASIESGVSLSSLVHQARSDTSRGLSVRTRVNGTLISADKRASVIIQDNDEIIVRIVPMNGDTQREKVANTKQIGGIASVLAGIGMFVLGLATGGMAWVALGFIVIGGLVSTVGAGLTASGVIGGPYADEMGTTNHPSIRGASNTSNPNGKVPLVLGKHYMAPGYLSPPYTELSGTDGIDEFLHMSFVLGYAPLTISQIQFGDMLVATNTANTTEGAIACDGVLPGCEVEIRQDVSAGHGLDLYPKEVIEQNFQTALSRYHVLSGLDLTVDATARTITRSSGDWTDSSNDVRVGDYVDFYSFDTAANNNRFLVTGISSTVIYCNQASTLVDESKSNVGVIVVPATIQTTAKHTTSISVTITFTKLCKYATDGTPGNASVIVYPYYRLKAAAGSPPNAWTLLGTFDSGSNTITRAKAETLRYTATSGTLTSGQYEVFLMRATADPTDSTIQDSVYWTSLRSHTGLEIMPAAYRKKVCILGVKVRSSEAVQNCISKLNCIVSADYSYIATADAGHDWASIIASNPQNAALAFVHAIMGPGNPRPRVTAQMDWTSIFALATWCDTLKGTGANQYRVEVNGIITQSMKLSALINEILAPARASLTMSEGTYGAVFDAVQATPKQHIGPHNSWGFRGTKTFGETIHGYRVKFVNKDEQYTVDERIVLDDGYKYDTEGDGVLRNCWGVDKSADATVLEATKFESIEAALDTNPAQVFGWGRYMLAVRRLRPELFTVNMDAENLAVKRGELVKVSHPAPRWGLADGRLTALTLDESDNITAVTTDNSLTMETGKDYAVRFRTQAETSIYRTVTLAVGETHELTLDTAIPDGEDIPAVGDWFGFGLAGLETVDCIVAGVDLNSDLSAKLTLFEAAPAVHTADLGTIPNFDSKVSFGPSASMPSAKTPIFPQAPDVIPYPATKALTTLSDTVDFTGQYGVFGGQRYVGTTPDTWTLDEAGQTASEVIAAVPIYSPRYLGAVLDGTPFMAQEGDVYLLYSATPNTVDPPTLADPPDHRGVFRYTSSAWVWTTERGDVFKVLRDIADVCALRSPDGSTALYGSEADYGITDTFDTAHIVMALIDRLRVGDLHIYGILKSRQMDTVNPQTGETVAAPTPTYWPGSDLITLCAGLADGWHTATGTLGGKNVTHVVKGGADNSVSYQSSDGEVNNDGIIKTITSGINGKITIFIDVKKHIYSTTAYININGSPVDSFVVDNATYSTHSVTINVAIGDIITVSTYNDVFGEYSYIYAKNFRLCPALNTIGIWNDTDPSALSIYTSDYYNVAGNVDVDTLTDFITADQIAYWKGSELFTLLAAKVSRYRIISLGGGTFNSKTCASVFIGENFLVIGYATGASDTINNNGFYNYSGSIVLDDVEGKTLFGDEDADGQYEVWVHNIPGTSDLVKTFRNTVSGAIHSITETRSPDRASGDIEATHALHAVHNSVDFVRDLSLHNYSGDMHVLDVFSNFTNDVLGDWKRVAKRIISAWVESTAYAAGDIRTNDTDKVYVCTLAGTSAASGGPTGTGLNITDGGAHWQYIGAASSGVFEKLISQIYSRTGQAWHSGGRKPTGSLHAASYTQDQIFTALAPCIPSDGDEIILSGWGGGFTASRAYRWNYETIFIYGANATNTSNLVIKHGSATAIGQVSITW